LKLANSNGGESRLETAISYLLVGGVVTSLFLEIIGMASFYYSYGHLHIMEKKALFIRGENFFRLIYGLLEGNGGQKGAVFLMTLGITILILTPYVRVILSVLFFAWRKNIKYMLITIVVLMVLTTSLLFH
jgi:uncharacterized membrane protein